MNLVSQASVGFWICTRQRQLLGSIIITFEWAKEKTRSGMFHGKVDWFNTKD